MDNSSLAPVILSDYVKHLQKDTRDRYVEKLQLFSSEDPYLMLKAVFSPIMTAEHLPNVEWGDIYVYLVNKSSVYTHKTLKAFKSLEGYKYFVSGFMKEVLLRKIPNTENFLVMAQVAHSQKLSEPPLKPWVAIHQNGTILFAHCTCMAGLDEVCSHVSATCFAVEASVKMSKSQSCTSELCTWLQPSTSSISYERTTNINFPSPQMKRRRADTGHVSDISRTLPSIPSPTVEEKNTLYKKLHQTGNKCAILSVLPGYCEEFIPDSANISLPPALSSLHDKSLCTLDLKNLIDRGRDLYNKLTHTKSHIANVERITRKQYKCEQWFNYRCGRVTASVLKAVTRTDLSKPSLSLIKKICYPKSAVFATEATRWGCKHENVAIEQYQQMHTTHTNFKVEDCGVFLDECHIFLAATPDAVASCDCCGKWIVEVKCPICVKDKDLSQLTPNENFCLYIDESGNPQLKKDHAYYFQVQAQIHAAKTTFCDFIVWTQHSITIQRIFEDTGFITKSLELASEFFYNCIIPELVGQWYTRERIDNVVSIDSSNICYCKQIDPDKTILRCASVSCTIKFFHKECLALKRVPKKWTCTFCKCREKTDLKKGQ